MIPLPAFGRKTELTASTTIKISSKSIITLVTFSTPFCTPNAQAPNEIKIAIIAQNAIVCGLESILLNAPDTASLLSPASLPVASIYA